MKKKLVLFGLLSGILSPLATPSWAGDVQGSILLKSDLAKRQIGKKKSDSSEDSGGYRGDVPKPSENELENVVVYIDGSNLKATPQNKRTRENTLLQKNKEFRPHVLAVTKGTTVYFENQDPFAHHIYSESKPGDFEIRKHTSGVRTQVFNETAVVETFCGIHTKMNCYILVLPNNYYCKAGANGGYWLKGVPAGNYKLTAWHPRLAKPIFRTIHVNATGSKTENIDL